MRSHFLRMQSMRNDPCPYRLMETLPMRSRRVGRAEHRSDDRIMMRFGVRSLIVRRFKFKVRRSFSRTGHRRPLRPRSTHERQRKTKRTFVLERTRGTAPSPGASGAVSYTRRRATRNTRYTPFRRHHVQTACRLPICSRALLPFVLRCPQPPRQTSHRKSRDPRGRRRLRRAPDRRRGPCHR